MGLARWYALEPPERFLEASTPTITQVILSRRLFQPSLPTDHHSMDWLDLAGINQGPFDAEHEVEHPAVGFAPGIKTAQEPLIERIRDDAPIVVVQNQLA